MINTREITTSHTGKKKKIGSGQKNKKIFVKYELELVKKEL